MKKTILSGRGRFSRILSRTYACILGLLLAACMLAGTSPAQDAGRKVVARSAPTYPDLAKKMHLSGKVKIEATVNAAGSVVSAKMVGGNPVFESAAVDAVKQWKFESAPATTKTVVVLEFAEP